MGKPNSKTVCLIISAVFTPEPIVSAKLSKELAVFLAENHDVMVVRPSPSRPFGYVIGSGVLEVYPFKLITLASYVYPKSHLFGRLRESFSFGKSTTAYISDYHDVIKVVYVNTWPLLTATITITN